MESRRQPSRSTYRCLECGGDLVATHGYWQCHECGYAPKHGAD